jgi:Na+/H+ antiporter NhaD/arsenite permease-like protein
MNAFLWVCQVILAGVFLFTGLSKLIAYEKVASLIEARSKGRPIEVTPGQAAFIGIAEIAGALGVVVPAHPFFPWSLLLVSWVCLALLMVAAGIYHLRRRESAVPSVVMFLLALFLMVGRWPWWG